MTFKRYGLGCSPNTLALSGPYLHAGNAGDQLLGVDLTAINNEDYRDEKDKLRDICQRNWSGMMLTTESLLRHQVPTIRRAHCKERYRINSSFQRAFDVSRSPSHKNKSGWLITA